MRRFADLEAFIAVVEAGSFTAAAERLDTAKSAVSRRVTALEERLGVQLLRRTTRRLNLTETGRSFYEHSARILADLEERVAPQREHLGMIENDVVLGASPDGGEPADGVLPDVAILGHPSAPAADPSGRGRPAAALPATGSAPAARN